MSDWIKYDYNDPNTKPEKGHPLYYYFDYVGVHLGQYYGEWTFASPNGFLTGDVTHWQYDEGQPVPEKPQGEGNE